MRVIWAKESVICILVINFNIFKNFYKKSQVLTIKNMENNKRWLHKHITSPVIQGSRRWGQDCRPHSHTGRVLPASKKNGPHLATSLITSFQTQLLCKCIWLVNTNHTHGILVTEDLAFTFPGFAIQDGTPEVGGDRWKPI